MPKKTFKHDALTYAKPYESMLTELRAILQLVKDRASSDDAATRMLEVAEEITFHMEVEHISIKIADKEMGQEVYSIQKNIVPKATQIRAL